MAIKHNVYEDGKVQSLGFTSEPSFHNMPGRDVTVGVLEPGKYNFGVAKRRETIHVTFGHIMAKGKNVVHSDTSSAEGELVFEEGEEIVLECQCVTAYICLYG